MKSSAEIAKKWQRNLASATESIRAGVQAVTVSPTELAARRQDAYAAGVQRSVTSGRYAAGCRRVTTQDWQRSVIEKGLPRIAAGASASIPKMQAHMDEFLPFLEEGQRKLEAMPRGDLQQNIQRAVAMMEHNAQFRSRR
jgi:hypothetical protein